MIKPHSFHIPVMGIGYSIDTPIKVSQYGIDSVISLVDDMLLEKLRKMYCTRFQLPYNEITDKTDDFRAKRITSYLNMLNKIAEKKFEELRSATIEKGNGIKEYCNMLPDSSSLKQEFKRLKEKYLNFNDFTAAIKENLTMGSIDVNIMTKVDKDNFRNGEQLPVEYNDGHAALRGFAQSDLHSSIVLSAGMNPRMYSYMAEFKDFFPDAAGNITKKIILKVSDYRSALIQGKFLAKKGLWISEFRIESGLNCGGHAFASDGHLMGPILAEFRDKRSELASELHEIMINALTSSNRTIPLEQLPQYITAQGGVGTNEEHEFLIDHYKVDSVGWGTPFLLVPEVTNVDKHTLQLMVDAKEDDLYLSGISPLGVPFNSLRNNTQDIEKEERIARGVPGSPCHKKYVATNNEFTNQRICTASRQYQRLKIEELKNAGLSPEEYQLQYNKVVEKACVCVGIGTSALLVNNIEHKLEGEGVSVCPGPNMAYFNKVMTLGEMVDHIYGRTNVISRTDRPNMFVKEIQLYINNLKERIEETKHTHAKGQEKKLLSFAGNLKEGIAYYQTMFSDLKERFEENRAQLLADLENNNKTLLLLMAQIKEMARA